MTSISRTIVKAGLLAATLDGLAASINFLYLHPKVSDCRFSIYLHCNIWKGCIR